MIVRDQNRKRDAIAVSAVHAVAACPPIHLDQNQAQQLNSKELMCLVGHFRLPLPLAFFTAVFLCKGFFPPNRCVKRRLTQLSTFNSRKMSFRMLTLFFCTRLLKTNSHVKTPGRCLISASHVSKKLPAIAVVKTTAVISALLLCNPLAA